MTKIISDYLADWWTIMARPIYFFTRLKEGSWQGAPLSFLLITNWGLALIATVVVFIVQYIPIGSTLVEGISGYKTIIILPVLLTLSLVFFVITLLIIGGLLVVASFFGFYALAAVLHYSSLCLGGKGSLNRMLQQTLYSSAVLLPLVLAMALTILTKYGGLSFELFKVGFNFLAFLLTLYAYGLWAIACRKVYNLPKSRAFLSALAPAVVLLIFVFIFDKIALPKLQSWIT